MHVLAPSLTPWGGIGVRMVNGRNGNKGKLSHSIDVVDVCSCACTHNNVDLHVNVCGSAHCCGCMVNGQPVEYHYALTLCY